MKQNNPVTKAYMKTAIYGFVALFIAVSTFGITSSAQAAQRDNYYNDHTSYHSYPVSYPVPQPYPQPYPVAQPYPVYTPVSYPVYQPQPIVYNYPVASYNSYNYTLPTNTYTNYTYYSPISASCYSNTTYTNTGTIVTWTANASGGSGYFSYTWTGTDGLYGSNSQASIYYSTPGTKSATVYIQSGNQNTSIQCSNYVTVSAPVYNYITAPTYTYVPVTGANPAIACFADATSVKAGVPVTWSVEATGFGPNPTYTWSGSDGFSGTQSTAITTYGTTGTKSAVVTVTGNGQVQSKACGNTVTVTKPAATYVTPVIHTAQPPVVVQQVAAPTTASLFSLANVPWGLVGILVILILLFAVIYLIYNAKKI